MKRNGESHITLDFSGVDALLQFLLEEDAGDDIVVDRVVKSAGYQTFLQHHKPRLDEEGLKRELAGLKGASTGQTKLLSHWSPLISQPKRLLKIVQQLKEEEGEIVSDIATKTFSWLPMVYFNKGTVFLIIDGMSSGYRARNGWVCDLWPAFENDEMSHNEIHVQLFHIIYGQELEHYFTEFWYRYREKIEDEGLIYSLWVLVELIKNGMPHFLLHHLRLFGDSDDEGLAGVSLPELAQMHHDLSDLLAGIEASGSAREYVRENISPFYEGRYNVFQLLGSFICSQVASHFGQTTLVQDISNPLQLYEHFLEAKADQSDRSIFGLSLTARGESDSNDVEAGGVITADDTVVRVENRATILGFEGRGPTDFCILVRGAGAGADGDQQKGVAHFCEHYLVHLVRQRVSGLTFLKGTTNHHHCLYCATCDGSVEETLNNIVPLLLEPKPEDQKLLSKIRRDVLVEIDLVSRNPFYDTERRLCDLMIEGYHPVRGEYESVARIGMEEVRDFAGLHYLPENLVVSICGPSAGGAVNSLARLLHSFGNSDGTSTSRNSFRIRSKGPRGNWNTVARGITTCTVGWPIIPLDSLEQSIVKRYVEHQASLCLKDNPPTFRCLVFSDYRDYGDFGIVLVNCQGLIEDIEQLIIHLTEVMSCANVDRGVANLKGFRDMEITYLKDILPDDRIAFVAATVTNNAWTKLDNGSQVRLPYDHLDIDFGHLFETLKSSLHLEHIRLAGSGPMEINFNLD